MAHLTICEHDEKAKLEMPATKCTLEWPYLPPIASEQTVTVEFYRCMDCGVVITMEVGL